MDIMDGINGVDLSPNPKLTLTTSIVTLQHYDDFTSIVVTLSYFHYKNSPAVDIFFIKSNWKNV